VGWLFNWDEAKRPWPTVIALSLSGLIGGGLIGYFRFGDNVGFGIALGLGFALILGAMGWRTVRDPARVAELTQRKALSPAALRPATIRLAVPFGVLVVAAVVGVATASVAVFVIVLAVGLAVGLAGGRFLPR
jgi:hypothetical protein